MSFHDIKLSAEFAEMRNKNSCFASLIGIQGAETSSVLYIGEQGEGLSVVFPAYMTYVMNHNVMRFAQVASRVWGCAMDFEHPEVTAKAGIQAFRNFLTSIGMPANFEQLGAKKEDIPLMANKACFGNKRPGYMQGFVKLEQSDVEKIYELML